MGKYVALVALFLMGCQALYGQKPDKLPGVKKTKRPPEEKVAAVEPKYLDDCPTNFRDTAPVRQEKALATKLTQDGDGAFDAAKKAKEAPVQAGAYKEAVDKYSNALKKDPFNAEATLKLAIAYDALFRRGCAIAMLKRLENLTKNKKVSPDAQNHANSVGDNPQWFKGYRKDAVAAAGL